MKNFLLEFAPYGAGSPPALVLALNLYKSILTATSADMWPLAALTAVLGVIFTIAIEAGTYKALALAFASREWKAAFIAAAGALTVTALIIFGVYSGAGTRALITSSVVMVAGYLVIMLNTYMIERKAERVQADTTSIALMGAETRLQNAKNRAAKLGTIAPVQLSTVNVHAGQFQTDPAQVERIRAYWRANPGASLREAAAACGCSPMTAKKYKGA